MESLERYHESKGISLMVSNRSMILFSKDKWCSDQPLKILFSDIYRVALKQRPKVLDHPDSGS